MWRFWKRLDLAAVLILIVLLLAALGLLVRSLVSRRWLDGLFGLVAPLVILQLLAGPQLLPPDLSLVIGNLYLLLLGGAVCPQQLLEAPRVTLRSLADQPHGELLWVVPVLRLLLVGLDLREVGRDLGPSRARRRQRDRGLSFGRLEVGSGRRKGGLMPGVGGALRRCQGARPMVRVSIAPLDAA